MISFSYIAVDQMGRVSKGYIDAHNELDIETRLGRLGLELVSYRQHQHSINHFLYRKVGNQDLAMFCYQLEQLHSAGLPLLESLQDLSSNCQHARFKKTLTAVSTDVESGKTLSQALLLHPLIFNQVFVSLIAAGEYAGKLSVALNHLFTTLRWQDELTAQTRRLLAYPMFLAAVMLFSVGFLMTYLVPQMVVFLTASGQILPLNTRILIAASELFVNYWWLILTLPITALAIFALVIKHMPSVREQYDALKLNLPIVGKVLKKIILARFCRYFALMYQAGIPILQALKISENIVVNHVFVKALQAVQLQINAGSTVHESFRNLALFPQPLISMIKVGENTGNLDHTLLNISQFYDSEVRNEIAHMLTMLEPLLTVMLGGILAFIMLSVLGPIYDSFTNFRF
jgi:type IV pilus assembly protein PilC